MYMNEIETSANGVSLRETGSVLSEISQDISLCCSNITRNNIVVILWLLGTPHERVNFSRAAPTGYSSTKVVPLAFLSTRRRHAISRIFRNLSRGTYRHRNTDIRVLDVPDFSRRKTDLERIKRKLIV